MRSLASRLAVCSWSLLPESADALISLLGEIGIRRVQLHLNPLLDSSGPWKDAGKRLADAGITLVSGMITMEGEDYSSLEAIHRTGGVVPDGTWEANWRNVQGTGAIAEALGLSLVTFHAGFIPSDPSDPLTAKLQERLRKISGCFAQHGLEAGFETGQETAETLRSFLTSLECENVGVNFDPANLLYYNMGDPIPAIETLAPWLRQCHIKDALPPERAGTAGREMPVGRGAVDWPGFFATLDRIGFTGDFAIEREDGERRAGDVREAADFVTSRFAT